MVFDKMEINTNDVLEAAKTKWNFLDFKPGLVGGHCIGVDPYYFTYKAEQLGYHSQIILAGRKINDEMGKYAATNIIKQIILSGQSVKGSKVAIFGITFKENIGDVRNTRVIDIIDELNEYGVNILVYDLVANKEEVKQEYNIELVEETELNKLNAVVLAVPHNNFKNKTIDSFNSLFNESKVMIDIKGVLNSEELKKHNYYYWTF